MKIKQRESLIIVLIIVSFFVLLYLLGDSNCQAQEAMQWRWADDTFLEPSGEICEDKVLHFEAHAVFDFGAYLLGASKKQRMLTSIVSGIAWEVKDAVAPWEMYGWLGGDGFSFNDIWANIAGVVFAELTIEVFEFLFLE